MNKEWSSEEIQKAIDLAATGLTSTEIGKILGRSRNSVIGRMHRSKVSFGVKRPPAEKKKKPEPKAKVEKIFIAKYSPYIEAVYVPEKTSPKPLMDAKRSECKYIVHSDHERPFKTLCCGNLVYRGSSWCKEHYQIVFVPRPQRGKPNGK